jgi:hypothetical protein
MKNTEKANKIQQRWLLINKINNINLVKLTTTKKKLKNKINNNP